MRQVECRILRQLGQFLCILAGVLLTGSVLGAPAYYLVFEIDETGFIEPVFAKQVEIATPLETLSEESLHAAGTATSRQNSPGMAFRLATADGRVVHRGIADVPRWLRGEFHGELTATGLREIEGHVLPAGRQAFVVRTPAWKGTSLRIESRTTSTFDLDVLMEMSSDLPLAYLAPVENVVMRTALSDDPANRVDLLFMGDGYTLAEQALFESHVAAFETTFFSITPYAEYRNFVNLVSLFTPSAESGADHPPYDPSCTGGLDCCSDSTASSDPLAGTYVDTAFDARYCANNIHRLLVVSDSAVLAAASAVPDWDRIVVTVNDETYGGAGGNLSVTSTHANALEIVQHEYGHSFTDLADEYDYPPYPSYPPCSDKSSRGCEPNVTNETVRNLVKWNAWIEPDTPVPTPEYDPAYDHVIGLFEGARYLTDDMYRPKDQNCLMHYLGQPFCEVCEQAYVLRLYDGDWGIPQSGIDPIEPGSESPATDPVVDGTGGVTLSVALLQPVGSPPLGETWSVDGVPQADQPDVPTGSFEFASSEPGLHTVDLLINDLTPLVHPDMAGDALQSSRTWSVDVGLAAGPGVAAGLMVDKSASTPGDLALSWAASCSPGAVDYAIYEGIIGDFTSHTMIDCSDDGDPFTEEVQPLPGGRYYLVVPLAFDSEGSYGTSSTAAERPVGMEVCQASQVIAACP